MKQDVTIPAFEAVDGRIAETLRSKTPTQRLEMVFQAHAFAKKMVEAGVRWQHPGLNESDVAREINRRMGCGSR